MDRTLQDLLREKTREFRDMAGDAAHASEANSGLREIFTPDPIDKRRYPYSAHRRVSIGL
jgi:hypothetical protein